MGQKIWDVEIGNNWSSHTVSARNYIEAGKKAIKLSAPPRDQSWISKVECVRETEE